MAMIVSSNYPTCNVNSLGNLVIVMDRPTSQYLQGISVKVTEKYKPPRKITLPAGLGHLEPSAELFNEDYGVVDESSALLLIDTICSRKRSERRERNERIAVFMKSKVEEEEKIDTRKEEATSIPLSDDVSNAVTSAPAPASVPIAKLQSTGPLLQNQQPPAMAVLTPIQSSLVGEPKKQNLTKSINLAEFEDYSSTPFEEMELKTLNDKEELAMLLQPSATVTQIPASGYGMQNMYSNHYPNWRESIPDTTYARPNFPQFSQPAWPLSGSPVANTFLEHNFNKMAIKTSSPSDSSGGVPVGILRQAKSVPDLSEMAIVNNQPNNAHPLYASPDKRLSSRTPPPRLHSNSISKQSALTTNKSTEYLNKTQSNLESNLNVTERRLVQQLADMGFPRDRAAKVVKRLGVTNEKNVVDQLLIIQSFVDLGHNPDDVDLALEALKLEKEWQQRLPTHLQLFNQMRALGFPQERIGSALVAAAYDRDKALDILLLM